jgi:SNF2 family DNA or RNA helicase
MQWFHDPVRRLLIYPRSDAIRARIPESRDINGAFVAVPATLQNAQTLRWMGYPIAPIITDENYNWPRPPGITPYESQKISANFMVAHPRCFNLSDMGVGKTNAAIWAADFLMRQHPPGAFRALIVAPRSILETKWADTIFKTFLGRRTFSILRGTPEQRLKALAQPADFYVINFDGVGVGAHTRKKFKLDGFSKELASRSDIRLAIVDEASAYKDSQTKRHRIARVVFGRKDYLFLMTGTPTAAAPTDAYGLAKLVNNAYGKSFTTFRQETMYNVTMGGRTSFKWMPLKDGYDKARKLLQPAIRFDISEVWDAPPLTTQQREVPLTAEQTRLMADLKRNLQIVTKSGQEITAIHEAAARQKFMQISLGAIYDQDHKAHRTDANPRLEELRAIIREAPAKVLIFVPLTSVVNMLHKELKEHTREIVNGPTSDRDRARIFSAFQLGPDPRLLIVDPGCVSHGLDLWAARTVVWYGPTEKTELYLQANKRAHRPGQTGPVSVIQLVSNKLEREIFRRLENNETMQGALLDLVRKGEL